MTPSPSSHVLPHEAGTMTLPSLVMAELRG